MMSQGIRIIIRRNRFGCNTPAATIDIVSSITTSREYHSSSTTAERTHCSLINRHNNFHKQQCQRLYIRGSPNLTKSAILKSTISPPRSFSSEVKVDEEFGAVKQYSTPELTADAAKHKAGLNDPSVPYYQNPLHHNNPDMKKMFPEDFNSKEEFEAAIVPLPPPDTTDGTTAAPEYIHAIADEIVHLTMLEMSELINKMADHYGFHEGILNPDDDTAAGGDAGGADDDDDGAAKAPVVEKTNFDIKLLEFTPEAKIKIIKEVRSLAGLGLKEAKEMVEGAPKTILKDVKKEQAEEIKQKLEEIGAKIEIV